MTALSDIIRARAPVSIAEYMELCLAHPQHGYYQTRDPLGRAGDFVTAPEISQMFGEILGLWLIQVWSDQGRPTRIILTELGPGRGTLMADILRVAKVLPSFLEAAEIWLVETSPMLRKKQAEMLGEQVNWADTIADLPDAPLFLIANEFFDALPIQQFRRVDSFWQERRVNAKFTETYARPLARPDLDQAFPLLSETKIVEVSEPSKTIAAEIGTRIKTHGGAALVIDYGEWDGVGNTLQAVQKHQTVDAFDHPHGLADLTAHVNFSALAKAAGGQTPFATQGGFLQRIGINERAQTLAKTAPDDVAKAHHRLTHGDEMGNLFKVMAILPDTAPAALGFEYDTDNSD